MEATAAVAVVGTRTVAMAASAATTTDHQPSEDATKHPPLPMYYTLFPPDPILTPTQKSKQAKEKKKNRHFGDEGRQVITSARARAREDKYNNSQGRAKLSGS